MTEHQSTVRAMIEAFNDGRFDDFGSHFGESGVLVFPQTDEQATGAATIEAMYRAYPATPALEVIGLRESGDLVMVDFRAGGPGQDEMRGLLLIEVVGGTVARMSAYFFPPMAAPEWRAPYVVRPAATD